MSCEREENDQPTIKEEGKGSKCEGKNSGKHLDVDQCSEYVNYNSFVVFFQFL